MLRSRLADAVRGRALLPMWFVTVLGPIGLAGRTQEWLDLAAEVMAYRVTYDVTDQAVALGLEPAAQSLRRARWHQELTEALRRLRLGGLRRWAPQKAGESMTARMAPG